MQLTTKQQMLDVLDETIKFYGEDVSRRGVQDSSGGCVYRTDDGKRCAVGRMCTPEQMEIAERCVDGVSELNHKLYRADLPTFQPRQFWSNLQCLHDDIYFWNKEGGLTDKGERAVQSFRDDINKGVYGYGG
jgi:hypothetical protein